MQGYIPFTCCLARGSVNHGHTKMDLSMRHSLLGVSSWYRPKWLVDAALHLHMDACPTNVPLMCTAKYPHAVHRQIVLVQYPVMCQYPRAKTITDQPPSFPPLHPSPSSNIHYDIR